MRENYGCRTLFQEKISKRFLKGKRRQMIMLTVRWHGIYIEKQMFARTNTQKGSTLIDNRHGRVKLIAKHSGVRWRRWRHWRKIDGWIYAGLDEGKRLIHIQLVATCCGRNTREKIILSNKEYSKRGKITREIFWSGNVSYKIIM